MFDPNPPQLAPRTNSKWPALLAWLVIVGCVGLVFFHNLTATPEYPPLSKEAFIMKLNAQMVIGLKAFSTHSAPKVPPDLDKTLDKMVQRYADDAETPEEKLDVAVISGEIDGKGAAASRLDDLTRTPLTPELAADVQALRSIYQNGPAALDAAAQARLIEHQDYFGRLALLYGSADDSAPRRSLEADAISKLICVGLVGFMLLLLFLASVGLFITGIIFLAQGKISRAYRPNPAANSAYLECFAIYLFLYIAYGYIVSKLGYERLAWAWPAFLILPLVMYWASRRGASAEERKQAFGWHGGSGWYKEIPLGIAGYLAGAPILAVGMFITAVLAKLTDTTPDHPLNHMLEGNGWHVLMLYSLACGFAPIMEETMFRGALFHHLRRRWGWWISAPLVSFIFAIIHPQGWVALPVLGAIALVLAGLREWRGTILASMAAHAFNNGVVLTIALLFLR